MIGSENHFFSQPKEAIENMRMGVYYLLRLKGYSKTQAYVYVKAYDYFTNNPESFDGATIVKDLCDIPDLDLDAMLHDYHYLICNVAADFSTKLKADWLYAKGQERKGKGLYSAYSRFAGLTLIGLGFVPFAITKRGCITQKQKDEFMKDYKILTAKERSE